MMSKKIFARLQQVRLLLVLTVGLGLVGGLLVIAEAAWLSRIVNRVFLLHQGVPDVSALLVWLLLTIVARAFIAWVSEVYALKLALRVKESLREQLLRKLFHLGPMYLRGERTGEVANTVVEGVEALEAYLARYLPQVAISALVPLAILIFVAPVDWVTAIIFVGTWPLIPFFMILIGKQAEAKSKRQFRSLSLLSAHFLDVLQGLATLKLFNRSRYQLEVIRKIGNQYRKATMETLRVAFLSAFVLELLTTLSTAIVAVLIGLRLIAGEMQFQDAFFVLLLAPEFYQPIRLLGTQFHAGLNGVTAAERIFAILDEPAPDSDAITTARDPFAGWGRIEFRQVRFRYKNADGDALKDLNLMLRRGEKVALVGSSGAGKSTVMQLLLGFATPTGGDIYVGDSRLAPSLQAVWRQHVAYLPQHSHLFSGTIADNLRFACPDCPFDHLREAAVRAGADEFIRELPQGYDTRVGENGFGLSGGQVQRIAIARAWLRPSEVLLMDEPTANLDPESERVIERAIQDLFADKTTLIIAHRLSTIARMDRILVLRDGKLVDQGSHQELLRRPGLYRQMLSAYTGGAGGTDE